MALFRIIHALFVGVHQSLVNAESREKVAYRLACVNVP